MELSAEVIDRLSQMFKPGDKVRVLRGKYQGATMTVRNSTSSEVWLEEIPRREVMSKGNLERL